MAPVYTVFPLGTDALTVDFGNRIDEALNHHVLCLFRRLQGAAPFIRDVIPAYGSLTVCFDPAVPVRGGQPVARAVEVLIETALKDPSPGPAPPPRRLRIPVCYAERFAPDLADLAAQQALSIGEVIRFHTAPVYRVYMIGFLPGFAYMGKVQGRLATPRRSRPRARVPAGAVGIAGEQTGIYPLASPGGWNLIGQTPVSLFEAATANVLLQPGDEVSFYSISENEFENYPGGLA